MGLKLITPPASFPLTLEEVKSHLNVDYADKDALIELYLQAAVDHAERFTGRALVDQTWELSLSEFPVGKITIPKPPLLEIVSIVYDDAAGSEQTVDAASYVVDYDSSPGSVSLLPALTWPTVLVAENSVRIRFRAGYLVDESPADGDVPSAIKAAILLIIGNFFENRETVSQGVVMEIKIAEQLLRDYRVSTSIA